MEYGKNLKTVAELEEIQELKRENEFLKDLVKRYEKELLKKERGNKDGRN